MIGRVFLGVVAGSLAGAAGAAQMLTWQVQEPGLDPYPTRALVTEDWLRLDDAVDEGGYLLFDRRDRTIYSVTHEDRSVLVIAPRKVDLDPPLALEREVRAVEPPEAPPAVAGKAPQLRELRVNGELCLNLVAVPGLLPEAVAALGEYRTVLAGEHARILPMVPADLHDACDLALSTFHPAWQLEFGLPIQSWGEQGGRSLVDFDPEFDAAPELFTLPEGYHRYGVDEAPAL